jgi:hypothetical protein
MRQRASVPAILVFDVAAAKMWMPGIGYKAGQDERQAE